MKNLIILAHPIQNSLNHHLKNTLIKHLNLNGNEVRVRDLYKIDFNPVLSEEDIKKQREGTVSNKIKQEQEHILWADRIIFIYPIWWTGPPAIFKGYIDRVFSYGFAYCYEQGVQKGLLNGKQCSIINTHGKSHTEYEVIGMNKALSLTSDCGIFNYCGLNVKQHLYFENADKATKEMINLWEDKIIATH
ncbi:NAD(P)H-dependent oxidoreductase [Marinomonas sp. TI.3.20]|uniref:NAD(P)H-dependent oxidoreductase n=1 Tax=Marinomonas sp. TI.3.20 TaxID=3121296 RepID=UPI00311D3548